MKNAGELFWTKFWPRRNQWRREWTKLITFSTKIFLKMKIFHKWKDITKDKNIHPYFRNITWKWRRIELMILGLLWQKLYKSNRTKAIIELQRIILTGMQIFRRNLILKYTVQINLHRATNPKALIEKLIINWQLFANLQYKKTNCIQHLYSQHH